MNAPQFLLKEYSEDVRHHVELAQQVIQELSLTLSGTPEIHPCYWPDDDEPGDCTPQDWTHDSVDGKILFFNVAGDTETMVAANLALAEKELQHQVVRDGQFTIVFIAGQDGHTC
jgi:hypothetical protein